MGQHSEQFNPINKHGHLPFKMLLMFAWRNLWRHRKRTIITLTSIATGFVLAFLSIVIQDCSHIEVCTQSQLSPQFSHAKE